MSKNQVITAIDLGTDKCVTLIAAVDSESRDLQVVGVSAVPSKGVRKSAIVDLEQALMAVTESIEAAERMAGFQIKSAYVSVAGPHVNSQNSKGVVAVASPNQEITNQDVNRVIEAARAVSLPNERTVIHVIPRDFKVDTQLGIKDPVGMTGIRLEAEAHIVSGMTTTIKNIEKCLHDAGITIDGFVFAGLASSEVVTTETERELGVVMVDIGAGSISVSAFVDGSLQLSTSVPIGARHITQDVALGCRISLEAAEKLKVSLSNEDLQTLKPRPGESKEELNTRRKKADVIRPEKIGITEDIGELSKKTIVEGIMVPRMKEMFELIGKLLQKHQLLQSVPAGLVISGGGAETIGIVEVAKRTLRLPARIGQPQEYRGLTKDVLKPSFSTSIGLLSYAKRHTPVSAGGQGLDLGQLLGAIPVGSLGKQAKKIFKSLLP